MIFELNLHCLIKYTSKQVWWLTEKLCFSRWMKMPLLDPGIMWEIKIFVHLRELQKYFNAFCCLSMTMLPKSWRLGFVWGGFLNYYLIWCPRPVLYFEGENVGKKVYLRPALKIKSRLYWSRLKWLMLIR